MYAIAVLAEIGLPRLPPHVITRLRQLATQDRRIITGGNIQTIIRDDDQLCAAISDLIDDTRPKTTLLAMCLNTVIEIPLK
jgi:hypothetical protein